MCVSWEEISPVQGTDEISGLFKQRKGSLSLTSWKVPADGTTLHPQHANKIFP